MEIYRKVVNVPDLSFFEKTDNHSTHRYSDYLTESKYNDVSCLSVNTDVEAHIEGNCDSTLLVLKNDAYSFLYDETLYRVYPGDVINFNLDVDHGLYFLDDINIDQDSHYPFYTGRLFISLVVDNWEGRTNPRLSTYKKRLDLIKDVIDFGLDKAFITETC